MSFLVLPVQLLYSSQGFDDRVGIQRQRRTENEMSVVKTPVCETKSYWATPAEALGLNDTTMEINPASGPYHITQCQEDHSTKSYWATPAEALGLNDTTMEINPASGPYHITQCQEDHSFCLGVAVERFESFCETEHRWQMASAREAGSKEEFGFRRVLLPLSCRCKLIPRPSVAHILAARGL